MVYEMIFYVFTNRWIANQKAEPTELYYITEFLAHFIQMNPFSANFFRSQ